MQSLTMPHLFQTRPEMAYNFAQRNIAHIRTLLRTLMSDIVDAEFAVAELRMGLVEPEVLEALVGVESRIGGVLMVYGAAVVELEYIRRRWPCEYIEPEEPAVDLELLLEGDP